VEKLGDLLHTMRNSVESKDILALQVGQRESPLVVFAPSREVMYPLSLLKDPDSGKTLGEGMLQDTSKQRGAFVEVKGWGNVMEGRSRREYIHSSRPHAPFVQLLLMISRDSAGGEIKRNSSKG
jgi:hypothetical protein